MTQVRTVAEELAARCESATGPDRELSCSIAKAIGWTPEVDEPGWSTSAPWAWCPDYTASLDAAMGLIPDGYRFALGDQYPTSWASVIDLATDPFSPTSGKAIAATPALALTAACLKARALTMTPEKGD